MKVITMNTSWYEQELVKEFKTVIAHSFPQVEELLKHCHVKLIESYWGRPRVHFLPYFTIYCPDNLIADVKAKISILREVAEYAGLVEVVCLNATHLLRDLMSKVKQTDPRLWLELQWLATQKQEHLL